MKNLLFCLIIVLSLAGCASNSKNMINNNLQILVLDNVNEIKAYPQNRVVLIGCRINQDKNGASLFEFSRRTSSWAGCSEGKNNPHFIIKTDVPLNVCNNKLIEVGAQATRQFSIVEAMHKKQSNHFSAESYLDGTPVMVTLRWKKDGKLYEVPFEKCFLEKIYDDDGNSIIKAFTPHFVYHGSGVLNGDNNRGCIVCQQDCSGGLICNNQEACISPVPLMKPNWNVLPKAGQLVTLVIYVGHGK